ncbi:MAG: HTTM domain-containing protein [bacterium]
MKTLSKLLFKQVDNSALVVFRIFFGFLITAEAWGAIATGWVKRAFVDPEVTFNFIGFEFLQVFVGEYMYLHFFLMGIAGIFVMLGYRYRLGIIWYFIFWCIAYFAQKSNYNNHYYLLVLLLGFMALTPANRYASLDVKRRPELKKISMPQWCSYLLILQMWIVYTYGSIAKLYPDWLNAHVIDVMMQAKKHYWLIGDLLQQNFMHYFLAYGGILFDGLVIPLLLYKPTRRITFFAAIFFHLFNSVVFQIGIFPYMSLALCLFFFEAKTIRNIFLKKKPLYDGNEIEIPKNANIWLGFAAIYFLFQIGLPLRHHFIQDNVLWTEEGHRLSWRMMLRSKSGTIVYKIINKADNKQLPFKFGDYLTKKQRRHLATHPDAIWQFAQFLKAEYVEQDIDVAIYVNCSVSVNQRPYKKYIDPQVDLTSVQWNPFRHSDWILPSDLGPIK